MQEQVAGVDNARTFGVDHSDKFRSHFDSVLVYCYLCCWLGDSKHIQAAKSTASHPVRTTKFKDFSKTRVCFSRGFSKAGKNLGL